MVEETKAIIASAKEKMMHTNIILDDMIKNKREYSSKDLSWRNLDLLKAVILSLDEVIMAVNNIAERTIPGIMESNEIKNEYEEDKEIIDEEEEVAEDMIEEDEKTIDEDEFEDEEVEDEDEDDDNEFDEGEEDEFEED